MDFAFRMSLQREKFFISAYEQRINEENAYHGKRAVRFI